MLLEPEQRIPTRQMPRQCLSLVSIRDTSVSPVGHKAVLAAMRTERSRVEHILGNVPDRLPTAPAPPPAAGQYVGGATLFLGVSVERLCPFE